MKSRNSLNRRPLNLRRNLLSLVTFSKVDKEGKKCSILKRCDCCYYMAFNKEDIISKINLNVFEQKFCIFIFCTQFYDNVRKGCDANLDDCIFINNSDVLYITDGS